MIRSGVLTLCALVLTGCASTSIPLDPTVPTPATLGEVNALLYGRQNLTITLADGTTFNDVYHVRIGVQDARFRTPGKDSVWVVASAAIETVGYVRDAGGRVGRTLGSAPGVGFIGLGAVALGVGVTSSDEGGIGAALLTVFGASMVLGGAASWAIGGAVGQAVGRAVSPRMRVTFFEGPVERYLPPSQPRDE